MMPSDVTTRNHDMNELAKMKRTPSSPLSRFGATIAMIATAIVGSNACTTEAFCFDEECESATANVETDSGASTGAGGMGIFPFPDVDTGTPNTDSGQGGSSSGGVDCTAIDTDPDVNHCGQCGRPCDLDDALAVCVGGVCQVDSCLEGLVDLNNDSTDGCECQITGNDVCDGQDNDCDGEIDEDTDTDTDVLHCGGCNVPCRDPDEGDPTCIAGECGYDCYDGFTGWDCQYACTATSDVDTTCDGVDDDCDGDIDEEVVTDEDCTVTCVNQDCTVSVVGDGELQGECTPGKTSCSGAQGMICLGGIRPLPEVCDDLDNNCNGIDDDGVDKLTDVLNCGGCNIKCAQGDECIAGDCQFTCPTGFADINNEPFDRCEYECPVWPIQSEICDGVDQDCNGDIDDGTLPAVGTTCNGEDCPTAPQ